MAGKKVRRGVFISFEGPEGCGKSLHSRLLYAYLQKRGFRCLYTREPGGTKLGERIRRILLRSKDDTAINDVAELFLFEACRAQIVREIMIPALRKKMVVISDRFSDATFAYQGYGGGLRIDMIKDIDAVAADRLVPHITILLDIDVITGLKRATRKRIDRMEAKTIRYHRRVRAGYLKIAKMHPSRFFVIKVKERISETQAEVRRAVDRFLGCRDRCH